MTGQDMEGCACDFLISAMGWIEGAPSPDPPRIAASRSGIGGTSSAPTAGATNSRPPKPGREFLDPWLYRSRLGPANTGFPIYKLTPAGSIRLQ